ncbi:MAG TPA: RsmE family RNA methyltransferase [Candidatus Acidoferrales bacterium]|nr:RsmE family RNA methyltransferase [Candidatus Acidoferrales bacterium]
MEKFEGQRAVLRGETAEHLGRVLRAEPGQLYELSDGEKVWLGRVEHVGRSGRSGAGIEFALVEPVAVEESKLRIRLLISIVKFDRFEWCLEKATELGVAEIIPLAASRSEKALVQAATKRAERWRKILLESAQQARCLRPPSLAAVSKPEEAFKACGEGTKILLSERREAKPIRELLGGTSAREVVLTIGPEGGWTDDEFAAAEKYGFKEASLRKQILRTETAVIAALAIVHYALADSST